jgi:hypothetical protein
MTAIFTWFASFLTEPVISGLIDTYKAKLQAVNSTDAHAIDLAKADLLAQIEARKIAASVQATRAGQWIDIVMALIVLPYIAKVIIWDKILGLGSTDPIQGAVGVWVSLWITFHWGGNIASNVVGSILGRFK